MKSKVNIRGFFCLFSLFCIIIFSAESLVGALNGIKVCYSIIVPSVFPLTVISLMLFESNLLKEQNGLTIYFMSLFGGFPVGAKLIEGAYNNGSISKKNAELMLCYCLNSAPAFIVSSVGIGILSNIRVGFIFLLSNFLSSVILMLITIPFKDKTENTKLKICEQNSFSDIFVKSTYDASNTMLSICGFIVLFSAIIEILKSILDDINPLLSFIEITNGIVLAEGSVYLIAFLIGFAGFCVHFQVLSICKTLKPRYILILITKIIHGFLMVVFSKIFIKIFNITVYTSSMAAKQIYKFSEISVCFGIAFICLSVLFIVSVSKEYNKM